MDSEKDINFETINESPVIEGNDVLFLYKGNANTVFLAGDYNRWELEDRMRRYDGSDLWYMKKVFPENSRFDYKYIVDGNWITDPLNKHTSPGGSGDNSTLIMPEYHSDYDSIISQEVPRGTLVRDLKHHSVHLGSVLNYHLYFPKGFNKEDRFHVMYALDGSDYLNFSKINLVLDFMIHQGEIPPLVCVLADPGDRTTEYTLHKPHYRYIVEELMPHVESEYIPCKNIIDRSVIGVSWGGLTAIYLAVNTPGTFSRVLSQSGSFWPKDWRIFHIINDAETRKIRFCLQTGTIQDTEEMNDAMAGLLTEKGYKLDYTKYAETHSWFNWKGHLNEGLIKLYQDL